VEAHEISPDVPISAMTTQVRYASMRIGAENVWLPQSVSERLKYLDAREDTNRTQFSHCRAFASESALRFDVAGAAPGGAAPAPVREIQLPAGLVLPLELESELASAKAVVGDLVTARLRQRVEAGTGLVLPKGALVRGRVRLLERGDAPAPHFILGLEFSEIEFEGLRALFYARLEETSGMAGLRMYLERSSAKTQRLGGGSMQEFQGITTTVEQYRVADVPGISTFFVQGDSFRLPKGLAMVWRTAALK
jgi:hypothetical protein